MKVEVCSTSVSKKGIRYMQVKIIEGETPKVGENLKVVVDEDKPVAPKEVENGL